MTSALRAFAAAEENVYKSQKELQRTTEATPDFWGRKEKKTRAEGESGGEESRSPVPPSLPRVLGGRETRRGERQQGPPGAAEERSSSPSSRGAEDATRLQSSQTTFSSVHFKEASDYVGAVYPEGIL